MKPNIGQAILGGFAATLVMTIIMYSAPMMGMSEMDVAAMLGSFMGGNWTLGMILHFINGSIIFSLLYAYFIYDWLPGNLWMRGALWGLALWFLSQAIVMPAMGNGFFSNQAPQPMIMVIGSLLGHLIYGAILGAVAGPQGQRERVTQAEPQRTVS